MVVHLNRFPRLVIATVSAVASLCSPSLGVLAQSSGTPAQTEIGDPFPIDAERVTAAGIRTYQGQHLTLYTDLPDPEQSQDLVKAFDAAVPQWQQIFEVDPDRVASWKMRAFLIAGPDSGARFKQAGLIPGDLPQFVAGFQRDHDFWLFAQPGPYYTRHLLLHEGTHAFMQWFTGGYGAPWYSEGMAELAGVHRWDQGQLKLMHRLRDREDAPYWGRVKLIKQEHASGQAMSLEDVLQIPGNAFRNVRFYAWSWAGCEFFSHHPLTSKAFGTLRTQTQLDTAAFNRTFRRQLDRHWNQLEADWQLFVDEIDYGFEVTQGVIQKLAGDAGAQEKTYQIQATRSWQSTGLPVSKGDRFRIQAKGRFVVGQTVTKTKVYPWTSEANGITIQYHRGQPLGKLQAGILSLDEKSPAERVRYLVRPINVGLQTELNIPANGVLCFRINDSPARLDDNEGGLEVLVDQIE